MILLTGVTNSEGALVSSLNFVFVDHPNVCMYVCMYVYMYVCMHVCMYASEMSRFSGRYRNRSDFELIGRNRNRRSQYYRSKYQKSNIFHQKQCLSSLMQK